MQILRRSVVGILLANCWGLALAQDSEVEALPPRWYPEAFVKQGAEIFQQHCAACHGAQAQGADNWRQAKPDGRYLAPPLNGAGHAWHHSLAGLYTMIMSGSPGGKGDMPAWQGTLNMEQAAAAIAWFQSHWSDEIYAEWYKIDQRARAKKKSQ